MRLVSFIIPAHEEEKLLGATLASLKQAAAGVSVPYELIVVDDASTDRTAAIAAEAGARVVAVQHRQIARARNAGARVAAGDLFIFVDADTIVGAATLRATVAAVEGGAVGGGALLTFDGPLSFAMRLGLRGLDAAMWLGRMAPGAYLFCTKTAFEATRGFDETLFVTEELTLSRALRRVGRTAILSERVLTSGRKTRTHGNWDLVKVCFRLFRHGPGWRRRRDGLDFWYGDRRDDR